MEPGNSNKINQRFNAHELPVNTTELWNNVVPHIRPKKDRKAWLFLLIFLGVALGVSVLILLTQDRDSMAVLRTSDSTIKKTHSSEAQLNNVPLKAQIPMEEASSIRATNTLDESQEEFDASMSKTQIKSENFKRSFVQENADISKSTKSLVLKPENLETNIQSLPQEPVFKREARNISKIEAPNKIVKTAFGYINLNRAFEISGSSDFEEKSQSIKPSWYLAITAGIGAPTMDLKTMDEDLQALVNKRKEIENSLESTFLQFSTSFRAPKWWSVSLGLQYSVSHFSSNHSIKYLEEINYEDVVIEIIQAQDGQQSEITGDATGKKEIEVSGTRYHTYQNLSARSDVGIWKTFGRHGIHGFVGLSYPVINRTTGLMYDGSESDYILGEDKENRFRTPIWAHAGIQYEYQISQGSMLSFGLYGSKSGNVYNLDFPVVQKLRVLGIQLGYIYKL